MTMDLAITDEQKAEPEAEFKAKGQSNKDVLDRFTDNGGTFDMIVKPMFQAGHEGELCSWLREAGLMRSSMNCRTETCNNRSMTWAPARSVDKYCWNCTECKKRETVRDSSFFMQIKCDLKLCMQIIVAWCQSHPCDVVESYLGIKHHVVKKAYDRLAKVAEKYVTKHKDEWIFGGSDKILIIDEFPGGYMTETLNAPVYKKRNNNCHTMLCIAEVDMDMKLFQIPPKMWMHIIQANPEPPSSKNAKTPKPITKCGMVEEALKEICAHAKPGSYLLANQRARCCNYESLQELKEYRVICIEDLQIYDTPGKNELLGNLKTIWQTGLGVCEEIQEMSRSLGQLTLCVHLWRQRFAQSSAVAFERIIQHIAECFPLS
ncbi:uncharacterized protein LOC131664495 [Phymastichus coffea]|uniref:uncharacterized protein LOC131664495 n=1 Tax=Phymastichus coffea TaxID=108790 RepID=UPI00273B5509|nr:uncharacterized protein LOC131664495 [Phymastichus coffea]